MPKVTVVHGDHAFEVTRTDNMPLSIFVQDCARHLGLGKKWRDELYVPGRGWLDVVEADCEVRLLAYFHVKVHFNGSKRKVRCSVGNTVLDIVSSVARELRLPHNWQQHLIIDQGYAWTTAFQAAGEIHLKDPRSQR